MISDNSVYPRVVRDFTAFQYIVHYKYFLIHILLKINREKVLHFVAYRSNIENKYSSECSEFYFKYFEVNF